MSIKLQQQDLSNYMQISNDNMNTNACQKQNKGKGFAIMI